MAVGLPIIVVIVVVIASVAMRVVLRSRGYNVGGSTIVRCRAGHLFTTIWVPLGSLKAVRLGWYRFQRCPVGHHWTLVAPVKESELTPEQIEFAREHKDVRIP